MQVVSGRVIAIFGVAFNNFPTLSRVVFDDEGFTLCLKVGSKKVKSEEEGG